MEMGSSSSYAGVGGGGGGDSINGLKFGKKIYFEDVGIGVSGKSSGGSTSNSAAAAAARRGRGVAQGGGPPRCQVEGCKVDLSDVKAYYSRHKVCGMHSKSPKVIVGGVEQRFCQQCSRFHLLPEFDQGKRSCRRRLAGHNERRRKPQPGSLFSSRYGRVSSFQENGSRVGGFLMDFTTYPRQMGRDAWPTTKAGNWADGNQPTPTGKHLPHQWQGNSESPPIYSQASQPYLQGGAGGMVFSSTRIPSNECFAAVSDSSCALSLLSNQPWGPRNHSNLEVNNLVNGGVTVAQSAAPHSAAATNFTSNMWGFKGNNEVSGSLHAMPHDFSLGMVSQPVNSHFSGELELAQQGDRQFVELGPSRDFGSSTHQMHWTH